MVMLSSCKNEGTPSARLKVGDYEAYLNIQGHQTPIGFRVISSETAELVNGKEHIALDAISYENDSVIIPMHIFDAEIRAKLEGEKLTGTWIKKYADDYEIPFEATLGHSTKEQRKATTKSISGRWKVWFSSDTVHHAIGQFTQGNNRVSGTFLTTTGDYRFLTGRVIDDSLYLTTFDGEHAFLFYAKIKDDLSLEGQFHSGKTWNESWVATKDENATLASADSITYLKASYTRFDFEALNLDRETISLKDEQYAGTPVLVQIMGTWCPNCMDETAFLADWALKKKPDNLKIISLAFERKNDFEYAKERLEALKQRYNIPYELAFAGPSDKKAAGEKLPSLNAVIAYPTLLFLDANHSVVKIHTGFTGPGTGDYFEEWKIDFKRGIDLICP